MKPAQPTHPAEPNDDDEVGDHARSAVARPGEEVFTDEDLSPSPEERRQLWRHRIDHAVTMVAVAAAGLWAGTVVAAHFCLAPALRASLPESLGDSVQHAAELRADGVALVCAATLLGAEVVRTLLGLRLPLAALARIRRLCAVLAGAIAAYVGLILTPKISWLLAAGASRGSEGAGAELVAVLGRAELGRVSAAGVLGLLIVLHIATLRPKAPSEPEDGLEAVAPLPPGPGPRQSP